VVIEAGALAAVAVLELISRMRRPCQACGRTGRTAGCAGRPALPPFLAIAGTMGGIKFLRNMMLGSGRLSDDLRLGELVATYMESFEHVWESSSPITEG
jgi:hypothetical protein